MKKTIELTKVRPGEIFEFADERFAKLPDEQGGATLVIREDGLFDLIPFEDNDNRKDHNNFEYSNLHRTIDAWLGSNDELFYASRAHKIDLTTMDGMTDYDMPYVFARVLTVMEYQRYRRYIPLASRAWWTATGYATASSPRADTYNAWYVKSDGTLDGHNVYYNRFAARPALYLASSTIVSVDADEGKELKDYTELELIEELQRRAKEASR